MPVPLLTFALTVGQLLLPRLQTLHLLSLFPLSVPLPGLQHQHSHQHERQDRVAGRHHLQTVVPPQKLLRPGLHPFDTDGQLPLHQFAIVDPAGDDPHALDDVGEVDDDAAHVEHQAGAVEEHVGLGGPVELDEEAEQAGADGGVQDARDDGRRRVQEAQVPLQHDVGLGRARGRVPQDRVVVGEEGEEDAEGETGRCSVRLVFSGGRRRDWGTQGNRGEGRGGVTRTAEDHKGCECGRAVASPGHRWQRWVRLAGLEGESAPLRGSRGG